MNALSLFSGIGGIDLACEWAGIKTVAFCEREPFCQKVLRKHWPDVPIYDDVCKLTKARLDADGIGTIDLIHGGYPCQPFSYAGKRKGTEDDRHLWPEYLRLVQEIRPRWVVGENVAGHITLGLDDVLADLEGEGYTARAIVLPACAVGAGHRRDRVFVVAYSGGGKRQSGTEVKGILRALPADGAIDNNAGGRSEAQSGEIVADTTSTRREARFSGQSGEVRVEARWTKPERLCDALAHTNSERCKERHTPAISEGLGQYSGGNHAGRAHGARRATQSRMGRGADELSRWLDGRGLNPLDALKGFIDAYPQPALMGQPQHEWEPPMVATGIKSRAARLKALGNAVDPLQIFPIMYAIKLIDDYLKSRQPEF